MVWLIEADFTAEDAEPTQRLLKPGCTYVIGRKPPADIVIHAKSVSAHAGSIHVECFDESQISNADYRPQMTFTASKKGSRIIAAEEEAAFLANPPGFVGTVLKSEEMRPVNDGEYIVVNKVAVVKIKVIWKSMLFNSPSKKDNLMEKVSQAITIGAHLRLQKGVPTCDFYVTSSVGLTTPVMAMLCSAVPIVSPAYVDEVLRLGALPVLDRNSLEAKFQLPDPDSFKPAIITQHEVVSDEELSAALSVNPARPTLFKGCTLLFVDTDSDVVEGQVVIAERCGATIERVQCTKLSSQTAIRQLLGRMKAKAATALTKHRNHLDKLPQGGLVILVDDPPEVSDKEWFTQLSHVARDMMVWMPPVGASSITHSVVHADAKRHMELMPEMSTEALETQAAVTQAQREQTPPAQRASTPPSMDVDEPAPQIASLLAPMAAPASLQTQSAQPVTQAQKPIKRPPPNISSALDDLFGPSVPVASTSKPTNAGFNSSMNPPRLAGTSAAAGSARTASAKPKPRPRDPADEWASIFDGGSSMPVGATGQSLATSLFPATQQSKSSKYRAKLSETDARASQAAAAAETQQSVGGGDSQMAPPTGATAAATSQRAIVEESQESRVSGKQRAAPSPPGEEEMEDGDTATTSRKKRTAELKRATKYGVTTSAPIEANESQGQAKGKVVRERSAGKAGIAPGERPDRDEGFLQALATKGRGKKSADQFDKEFNQLRIAKPNGGSTYVDQEEVDDQAYERFRQADAEELDELFSKKTGNFVEVDFVPLIYAKPERDVTQLQQTHADVPNFKKFKKKAQARRTPMALSMPVEQDFLAGGQQRSSTTQARAGEAHGSQIDELAEDEDVMGDVDLRTSSTLAASVKKGKSIFSAGSGDEEEEDGPILGNKRRKTGGANPTPRARAGTRAVSSRARSKAPIMLDDDVDIDLNEVDEPKEPEVDLRLDVDFDGMDTTIEAPRRATSSRAKGKSTRARSDSQASTAGAAVASGTRTSKKRTIPLDDSDEIIDEESDDEVTFGGFKSTRSRVPPSSAANKRTRR